MLCSHPKADVLSPMASMQLSVASSSKQDNQMLIAIPTNSSRLFTPLWPNIGLVGGICKRQALPDRL